MSETTENDSRVFMVGPYIGYNLDSYTKMALERLGYPVTFFEYNKFLGRFASPIRMTTSRSAILRALASPLILKKINRKLQEQLSNFEATHLLTVKGEIILPSTLDYIREELGIKTILWFPDDPNFFESLTRYIAPHYEYVFTASKKSIPRYKEAGVKDVGHLQFTCEPSVHKQVELLPEEKSMFKSDISLVGTYYPRRHKFLKKITDYDINIYGPYWRFFMRKENVHDSIWGPGMVKVFNASKIVLDIYHPDVLKYQASARTPEVTGCGSFLLTEWADGITEMFTPGKEIVCYKDETELRELLDYYLDDDDERLEIAANGQKRAYTDHTIDRRMQQLFELVN